MAGKLIVVKRKGGSNVQSATIAMKVPNGTAPEEPAPMRKKLRRNSDRNSTLGAEKH